MLAQDQSKWLVLSSFFMGLPSIMFYMKNLRLESTAVITTSLVSANYWRKPEKGFRRNLDIYVSRITTAYFLWNYYTTSSDFRILTCILLFYWRSCRLFEKHIPTWWEYHFAFHATVAIEFTRISMGCIYTD